MCASIVSDVGTYPRYVRIINDVLIRYFFSDTSRCVQKDVLYNLSGGKDYFSERVTVTLPEPPRRSSICWRVVTPSTLPKRVRFHTFVS